MRVLMFALFAAPLVVYASDSGADLRAMCLAEVRGKNR